MSTRSNIAIKLKEEDRNRDFIAPDNSVFNPGGKAYLQIYCHFDGYPDGVGQDLLDEKFTYEEALNFIMLGDHSTVKEAYIFRGESWQQDKPDCMNLNVMKTIYTVSWMMIGMLKQVKVGNW